MSHLKTIDRRNLVYTIIQDHDTLSPTEIIRIAQDQYNTKLYLKSTKLDIEYLNAQNYKWMHEQAKDAWHYTVKWMHDDTKKDIRRLDNLIEKLIQFEDDPEFTAIKNILNDVNMDAVVKDGILAVLKDTYNKAPLRSIIGKIAYAQSVKTDHRRFLIEMMQDQSLYEAVMEYSRDFHKWNTQKQLKEDNKSFQESNK